MKTKYVSVLMTIFISQFSFAQSSIVEKTFNSIGVDNKSVGLRWNSTGKYKEGQIGYARRSKSYVNPDAINQAEYDSIMKNAKNIEEAKAEGRFDNPKVIIRAKNPLQDVVFSAQ